MRISNNPKGIMTVDQGFDGDHIKELIKRVIQLRSEVDEEQEDVKDLLIQVQADLQGALNGIKRAEGKFEIAESLLDAY